MGGRLATAGLNSCAPVYAPGAPLAAQRSTAPAVTGPIPGTCSSWRLDFSSGVPHPRSQSPSAISRERVRPTPGTWRRSRDPTPGSMKGSPGTDTSRTRTGSAGKSGRRSRLQAPNDQPRTRYRGRGERPRRIWLCLVFTQQRPGPALKVAENPQELAAGATRPSACASWTQTPVAEPAPNLQARTCPVPRGLGSAG
ncbi:MAG: hypothetical protein ACI87O_000215 [Planctomycetota bacterium]|jgi:hypothetical protein